MSKSAVGRFEPNRDLPQGTRTATSCVDHSLRWLLHIANDYHVYTLRCRCQFVYSYAFQPNLIVGDLLGYSRHCWLSENKGSPLTVRDIASHPAWGDGRERGRGREREGINWYIQWELSFYQCGSPESFFHHYCRRTFSYFGHNGDMAVEAFLIEFPGFVVFHWTPRTPLCVSYLCLSIR